MYNQIPQKPINMWGTGLQAGSRCHGVTINAAVQQWQLSRFFFGGRFTETKRLERPDKDKNFCASAVRKGSCEE